MKLIKVKCMKEKKLQNIESFIRKNLQNFFKTGSWIHVLLNLCFFAVIEKNAHQRLKWIWFDDVEGRESACSLPVSFLCPRRKPQKSAEDSTPHEYFNKSISYKKKKNWKLLVMGKTFQELKILLQCLRQRNWFCWKNTLRENFVLEKHWKLTYFPKKIIKFWNIEKKISILRWIWTQDRSFFNWWNLS